MKIQNTKLLYFLEDFRLPSQEAIAWLCCYNIKYSRFETKLSENGFSNSLFGLIFPLLYPSSMIPFLSSLSNLNISTDSINSFSSPTSLNLISKIPILLLSLPSKTQNSLNYTQSFSFLSKFYGIYKLPSFNLPCGRCFFAQPTNWELRNRRTDSFWDFKVQKIWSSYSSHFINSVKYDSFNPTIININWRRF